MIHEENSVEERVLSWADGDGEIIDPDGCPYDPHPVVVVSETVDPPATVRHFAGPDWRPAYLGGGYLGSCPVDLVTELLDEHGQGNAIPRPDGWRDPDDEDCQ